MRKKFTFLLSLVVLVSLFSFGAIIASAAELTPTSENTVAMIDDEEFTSLQAAINAAEAGDTVTLVKNVTLGKYSQGAKDTAITINKAITLDGNGKTLTSQAASAIKVNVAGDVEIKNLTIKQYAGRNSNDKKYCVYVVDKSVNLTLTNSFLSLVTHGNCSSYTSGVYVEESAAGSNIVVDTCTIQTIYGIWIYGNSTNVTVQNSTINKEVLYGIAISGANHVDIKNSTIETKASMGANNFAIAIYFAGNGASVTADENTKINVPSPSGTGPSAALLVYNKLADAGVIDISKAQITKGDADDAVIYLYKGKAQIYHEDGIVMYDTLDEAIAALTPDDALSQLKSLANETITVDSINAKLEELGRDFYYGSDGKAILKLPVAELNGKVYTSLAAAIEAANSGDTITFLADINEDVEINKDLIIDGADFSYSGQIKTMKVDLTIQNLNFVRAQLNKNKAEKSGGVGGTYKILDCTFNGKGIGNYALLLHDTKNIVVENVTAVGYLGFLQVLSSNESVQVKNVKVTNAFYAFKIDYSNGVTIENAEVNGGTLAVYDSNYGDKTYVIKNCTLNSKTSVKIWEQGNATTTFKFEGVNELGSGVIIDSQYANYQGTQVGTKVYPTFDEALAAAKDGDTIKLLNNLTLTKKIVVNKKITLDLNGKTISGDFYDPYGIIYVKKGATLTVTNGTIKADQIFAIGNYGTVIVEDGAVIEGGYTEQYGPEAGIYNLYYTANYYGSTVINGGSVNRVYNCGELTVNGGEIETVDNSGKLVVNGGKIATLIGRDGTDAVGIADAGKISVIGGTIGTANCVSGNLYVNGGKITGTITIVLVDGTDTDHYVVKDNVYYTAVAWINKGGYFASLVDAIEYSNTKTSCTYVELLCDSEGPGFVVKESVEIRFNDYTYTITKGVGSTGTESNGIQQLNGALVLRNGTLKVADSAADKMYILVQSYDDLTVTGMTLDGTNLDKWSKHEDQVVNGDSYVVSKNNGKFVINTSNIITNDDGSKAFAFDLCDQRAYGYMDLPYASVATTTTINGVPVKESLDKVEAAANYSIYYYATIEQAIAKHASAALIGDVVLKDTVVIPEGKTFTLDLNGHTITMKTAEYKSAIENNGTLTIKDSGENGGIAMIFTGTPSTAKAVNTISNRGKLTVQGGNISNTGSGNQIGYAIDNYNGATLTVKGGNITASGSTYYDAIRLFCGSKETKVTVSGGYVSSIWAQNPSANKASEVNGSVVVTGGEIGTIYYENYTTVTITTKIAGNYNVVAYGANSENATSAKVAKNTVYSFAN